MNVQVKVSPLIREWVVANYGSNTIVCRPRDFFSSKLKYLLQLQPHDQHFTALPDEECININYGKLTIGRWRSLEHKQLNQNYYTYLSAESQRLLSQEIYRQFKSSFHGFMLGFCIADGNMPGSYRRGICEFMSRYNLPHNAINYEMLKKNWDRSAIKATFFKKN